MTVTWNGIGAITGKMERAQRGIKAGTVAIAASQAVKGQQAMKQNAPWGDRSGAARQGLYGESEGSADGAVIVLGGVVDYQPFLENGTSRMAARPIIGPTADVIARDASEELIALAKRFGL